MSDSSLYVAMMEDHFKQHERRVNDLLVNNNMWRERALIAEGKLPTQPLHLVFQDVTDEALKAGYDHHAPLLAFVEAETAEGKSVRIGEWVKLSTLRQDMTFLVISHLPLGKV